eukprot:scaffold40526_cov71-Phaeocystis_antarctica.AAC.4
MSASSDFRAAQSVLVLPVDPPSPAMVSARTLNRLCALLASASAAPILSNWSILTKNESTVSTWRCVARHVTPISLLARSNASIRSGSRVYSPTLAPSTAADLSRLRARFTRREPNVRWHAARLSRSSRLSITSSSFGVNAASDEKWRAAFHALLVCLSMALSGFPCTKVSDRCACVNMPPHVSSTSISAAAYDSARPPS